jgi:hypothetical protein
MVMGQILAKYGTNFLQTMPLVTLTSGSLTSGYELQSTRDNGRVPFVSFQGGRLMAIAEK